MAGQVKFTGMVLFSMPVGDYDRRLTILTRERGKISAFAKGARKPTSPLLGCSQPFSFGEFVVYEGKSSYNIVSADISNYFVELREDVESIYYAMYFCEFSAYMTKENLEASEPLKLLYVTLRALSKPSLNKKLIRRIFELRFMAINGEMPQVEHCVVCGKKEMTKETNAWFSPKEGGVLCAECWKKRQIETKKEFAPIVFSENSTIYTMQYILFTPLEKLFSFIVSEAVLKELTEAVVKFLEMHIGQPMKSEEMLSIL